MRRRALLLGGVVAAPFVLQAAGRVQPVGPVVAAVGRRLSALGRSNEDDSPPPDRVILSVDATRVLRPISPLIYGIVGGAQELQSTGARLNRWGGNPNTRYNWALGSAWNAGRDWEFRDYGGQQTAPSSVADGFVEANVSLGAESWITVPAIGWVARDGSTDTRSLDVPASGGAPIAPGSDAIHGYDPQANRRRTSVQSAPHKPTPFGDSPDPVGPVVYQDEWIHHLVRRFGGAAAGGVRFYSIDNEPDLWATTHTDVHPAEPGYEDVLATFIEYADAIKDVDPGAQVTGPALSGWTALEYSALDRGTDNFRTHADRTAHNNVPFLEWWLDQVRQHDEALGRRSLDVLDVHYYPQASGVFGGRTDQATNRLRLRSTRSLWDPTYSDESWIGQAVQLIPRLRGVIERCYPGTRLALGEWNWGAHETANGAMAIGQVLGIYGREGLDMAAYWTCPPPGSPGALAFKMYTNYDDQGHGFGDQCVPASSNYPSHVSVFASRDSQTQELMVMMLNQQPGPHVPVTLNMRGDSAAKQAIGFRYAAGLDRIERLLSPVNDNGDIVLPGESLTLIRFATGEE